MTAPMHTLRIYERKSNPFAGIHDQNHDEAGNTHTIQNCELLILLHVIFISFDILTRVMPFISTQSRVFSLWSLVYLQLIPNREITG